jgi:hypothetical protein
MLIGPIEESANRAIPDTRSLGIIPASSLNTVYQSVDDFLNVFAKGDVSRRGDVHEGLTCEVVKRLFDGGGATEIWLSPDQGDRPVKVIAVTAGEALKQEIVCRNTLNADFDLWLPSWVKATDSASGAIVSEEELSLEFRSVNAREIVSAAFAGKALGIPADTPAIYRFNDLGTDPTLSFAWDGTMIVPAGSAAQSQRGERLFFGTKTIIVVANVAVAFACFAALHFRRRSKMGSE